MTEPITILFVCTGNSCRSQMAEGLARYLGGDAVDAYSAGVYPIGIVERTYAVMDEISVSISGQTSDSIDFYVGQPFDYVITLCSYAEETCPSWTGVGERLHWPVPDPYSAPGTEDQVIAAYRLARDMIRDRVIGLFEEVGVEMDADKAAQFKGN